MSVTAGAAPLLLSTTTIFPDASPDSATELSTLIDTITNCDKCPALVGCRTRPVAGVGAASAHILFVGEAPGRLGADQTGVPFTKDRSGELFQRILARLVAQVRWPVRVFVTNAVKCLPADNRGRNRTPTRAEILNCRPHLASEIRIVRPRVVVPLGRIASQVVLGVPRFDWWRPIMCSPVVFPAKHPAYVIRGGGRERLTEESYLERLKPLLGLLEPPSVSS